jgi:hypothetical protein
MKKIVTSMALAALAVPAFAQAGTTQSANSLCKSQRTQMGASAFNQTYGTTADRSNAFGKCVSKMTRTIERSHDNAAKNCRAEQGDANFAASHDGNSFAEVYGGGKNAHAAFGNCVSSKSRSATAAAQRAIIRAARACKSERSADRTAFNGTYGTGRNAFGKCVSAKAKTQHSS